MKLPYSAALMFAFPVLMLIATPASPQATLPSDARKLVDLIYPPGSYAATFRTSMHDFMAKQDDNADRMRAADMAIEKQAAKLGQVQEPIVREQMIKVAAAKFSPTELAAIIAFLESPAGQAYSKHLPAITAVLESPEQAAAMMVATAELSETIEAADSK